MSNTNASATDGTPIAGPSASDPSHAHISAAGILDTSSQTPTTFTCFPILPLELRRKIWANMLPESRKIMINPVCPVFLRNECERLAVFFNESLYWNPLPDCGELVPIVLSINKESRQEALRFLTLRYCEAEDEEHTLQEYNGMEIENFLPLKGMYANYELDWICVESLQLLTSHMADHQKSLIQLLVVDDWDAQEAEGLDPMVVNDFLKLEALRKLFLVSALQDMLDYHHVAAENGHTTFSAKDLVKHKLNEEDDGEERLQNIPLGIRRLKRLWGEACKERGGTGKHNVTIGTAKFVVCGAASAGDRVIGPGDEIKLEEGAGEEEEEQIGQEASQYEVEEVEETEL